MNFKLIVAIAFLIIFILEFTGCISIPQQEISPEEFIEIYSMTRYPGNYWEYEGVKWGNHVMVHYAFYNLSSPEPDKTVYVSKDKLPETFPALKQRKIIDYAFISYEFPVVVKCVWPFGVHKDILLKIILSSHVQTMHSPNKLEL